MLRFGSRKNSGIGEWLQRELVERYETSHKPLLESFVEGSRSGRKEPAAARESIFILSTARRQRPLRKAGEYLKSNNLMRIRPLRLGLRSMKVGAQCSSLLLASKLANYFGDVRPSSAPAIGRPEVIGSCLGLIPTNALGFRC
jgi:hypothetical protein